ncbi:MAG: Uma2 family endonuclease [Candidatus Contendobacter sp.]|nr:Uma2 family endonuclease [Candidatus Contendobacter sp.]MDS4059448.1 Uma2 family endonuclease [Candidatus Contendobacter sp.]
MSAQLQPRWLSVEDYLAFEERSEIKHEYINGEIYAMAGASARHNQIAGNLFARLLAHLRGSPCQVFFADVKLHLKELGADIFYYPDLMVCCDPNDRDPYYRTRPCLIVEVLSSGTARTDQREKLFAYARLDSLQGYLLLEQDRIGAILHWREGGDWRRVEFNDPQTELTLPCAGLTIRLAELYEGTGLPEASPNAEGSS